MSEPEEKEAEKPPRPPLMVETPTLAIRLHRHIHPDPVPGCEGCQARANMLASKKNEKK